MDTNEILVIDELRKGSYKAFTIIYDNYADKLYGFVIKQLRNKQLAEDVVQDTFMRLWDNREQVNCLGNIQSFIFTIAKHRIIDLFRRQINEYQYQEFIEFCKNKEDNLTPEDTYLYDEFLKQLEKSKKVLSQRECEIYELSREKNLQLKDIALKLKLSEQTVKNYLSSALKVLHHEMLKYINIFIFFL